MKPYLQVVNLALCLVTCAQLSAATHAWLFDGQSNMSGHGAGACAQALAPIVKQAGHGYFPIKKGIGGCAIELWLDSKHKHYKRNWGDTEAALQDAMNRGHHIAGMVWFQGESNVPGNPARYEQSLLQLAAKVRGTVKNPKLPIFVIQLGPGTYFESHGQWSLGILREAQRRAALADEHIFCIAANHAAIPDRIVHLRNEPDSHQLVAKDLAKAVAREVYGQSQVGYGPRIAHAAFANAERTVVVAEFSGVQGALQLEPEALGGFFASKEFRLPDDLATAPSPLKMPALLDDHLVPDAARTDGNRLFLRFSEALPVEATLSWAVAGHAALGRGRRWTLPFARLTDDSACQTPSFAAIAIRPHDGQMAATVPGPSQLRPAAQVLSTVAVRLGKDRRGVLAIDAVAGCEGQRQACWNPTARFTFDHLLNDKGEVTKTWVSSYLHRSKYRGAPDADPDARLRGEGNGGVVKVGGLNPAKRYAITFYVTSQGVKPNPWAVLSLGHQPDISAKDKQKGRSKLPKPIYSQKLTITQDTAAVDAHGWQRAHAGNGWRGNMVQLDDVDPGSLGVLVFTFNAPPAKKARTPNPATDAFVCGFQVREMSAE